MPVLPPFRKCPASLRIDNHPLKQVGKDAPGKINESQLLIEIPLNGGFKFYRVSWFFAGPLYPSAGRILVEKSPLNWPEKHLKSTAQESMQSLELECAHEPIGPA